VALIRALVVTKLDYYCCSVLIGVSGTLLRRCASVIFSLLAGFLMGRLFNMTPQLRELHWLKITERILSHYKVSPMRNSPRGEKITL